MILTLLMWLGFAVLGILVLCTAAFGLMFFVSKAAVDFAQHPMDCQCGECQSRRLSHAHDNRPNKPRGRDDRDIKPKGTERWVSTYELRKGMFVAGGKNRDKSYRVAGIVVVENGDRKVTLVNIVTRAESPVFVKADRIYKPIWLVVAE